jgi:hypothetical protein
VDTGTLCEAYTPVCSYASLTKDATVACIAYPAETFIGTNFAAAAFTVNKLDEATADECLRVTEPHPATSHKEKVNGVTFDVMLVAWQRAMCLMLMLIGIFIKTDAMNWI